MYAVVNCLQIPSARRKESNTLLAYSPPLSERIGTTSCRIVSSCTGQTVLDTKRNLGFLLQKIYDGEPREIVNHAKEITTSTRRHGSHWSAHIRVDEVQRLIGFSVQLFEKRKLTFKPAFTVNMAATVYATSSTSLRVTFDGVPYGDSIVIYTKEFLPLSAKITSCLLLSSNSTKFVRFTHIGLPT